MTTRHIRWLIAALGLVMMPLMAGAQPAKIELDRVSGNCSALNSKFLTGVNDLLGSHQGKWANTHYHIVVNEVSLSEHIARNFIDLNQSFSPPERVTRQDPSGTRTCFRTSAFNIRFGARTLITRIHWDPLFPPCQPCATEWANHVAFIDLHERKHLTGIMRVLETADSEWPRGFPSARVIEACGPAGATIIRDSLLNSLLRKEIGAQLTATGTRLHSQIKEHAAALDSRESLGFMNCSPCRCQVPAECMDLTVSPHEMRGGAPASGNVTVLSAAPPGGADILLKSDNPAASVPSQLNVPEGATNQTFGITLTPVQQITKGSIHATRPGAGRICSVELWVYPPELVGLETPSQMTGSPAKKEGEGTVTLSTVAPAGGIEVQLLLYGGKDLDIPNAVVVPAGALQAKFDIDAKPRGRTGFSSQKIQASWFGKSITKVITVY